LRVIVSVAWVLDLLSAAWLACFRRPVVSGFSKQQVLRAARSARSCDARDGGGENAAGNNRLDLYWKKKISRWTKQWRA